MKEKMPAAMLQLAVATKAVEAPSQNVESILNACCVRACGEAAAACGGFATRGVLSPGAARGGSRDCIRPFRVRTVESAASAHQPLLWARRLLWKYDREDGSR